MSLSISRRHALIAASAACALPLAARAQAAWPAKPVTLIVPFPAGGGTDAFARPLATQFSKLTGKALVIDNRGGAGGTLGASVAAKAPADGYTLFMGGAHHVVAPSMYPKLDYDIEKDFVPLIQLASVPQVVVGMAVGLARLQQRRDSNGTVVAHESAPVASASQVAASVSTTLGGLPRVCLGPSTHCAAAYGGTRTSTDRPGSSAARLSTVPRTAAALEAALVIAAFAVMAHGVLLRSADRAPNRRAVSIATASRAPTCTSLSTAWRSSQHWRSAPGRRSSRWVTTLL